MQIHNLQSTYKYKKSKRVGRGGKRGSYSGKGQKGQKSRAGHKIRPQIRELMMRIPKKRGLGFDVTSHKPGIVNLKDITKTFPSGAQISPKTLLRAGLINRPNHGSMPVVKILGNDNIKKKFIITGCLISKSAKESIAKAGGKIV